MYVYRVPEVDSVVSANSNMFLFGKAFMMLSGFTGGWGLQFDYTYCQPFFLYLHYQSTIYMCRSLSCTSPNPCSIFSLSFVQVFLTKIRIEIWTGYIQGYACLTPSFMRVPQFLIVLLMNHESMQAMIPGVHERIAHFVHMYCVSIHEV